MRECRPIKCQLHSLYTSGAANVDSGWTMVGSIALPAVATGTTCLCAAISHTSALHGPPDNACCARCSDIWHIKCRLQRQCWAVNTPAALDMMHVYSVLSGYDPDPCGSQPTVSHTHVHPICPLWGPLFARTRLLTAPPWADLVVAGHCAARLAALRATTGRTGLRRSRSRTSRRECII
jgi:hypothetical protein